MSEKLQEQTIQQFTKVIGHNKYIVTNKIIGANNMENEEKNISEFEEQEKVAKLVENEQNQVDEKEPPKRAKRPRKTIEQEIAELDAKRERLMEKKRRQDAHEKIVFGATVIAMLKEMKAKNDKNREIMIKNIINFSKTEQMKNEESIINIIQKYKI